MTRDEFINWALKHRWRKDRYGHLQKEIKDKKYRLKLSRIAVRYETQITPNAYSYIKHQWVRIRSGYFSKLHITTEGKIAGMSK